MVVVVVRRSLMCPANHGVTAAFLQQFAFTSCATFRAVFKEDHMM